MLEKNINLDNKRILVTGAAGFIGAHVVKQLLDTYKNVYIVGVDNMSDYYDVALKEYRLNLINHQVYNSNTGCRKEQNDNLHKERFVFVKENIADKEAIHKIFTKYRPHVVVNLAAQPGVRYSISNPDAYMESNIMGFFNILEECRGSYDIKDKDYQDVKDEDIKNKKDKDEHYIEDKNYQGVEHLVYASSSSVYGMYDKVPYSTKDKVDCPVSLYAATKKSNELMAHAYAKLYNIPCTGLRFFTVYGPAGRPDMAYFSFVDKLRRGEKIKIFNYGNCMRDFTYIDDIVEGVICVMEVTPIRNTGEDGLPIPPYRIYNIGNSKPENLLDFVNVLIEECISEGILDTNKDYEKMKELVPMQLGDVAVTYADTSLLEEDFGFKPSTNLRDGLRKFIRWYKEFYDSKE